MALDAVSRMRALTISCGLSTIMVLGSPFIETAWFDAVLAVGIVAGLVVYAWPKPKNVSVSKKHDFGDE